MAVLEIIKEDNPILRNKSQDIKYISKNIKTLIQDMKETMVHYNGMGLAAPQIGQNINLIVIGNKKDQMELINPVILDKQGIIESEEECLSCGDKKVIVKRSQIILVKYLTKNNKEKKIVAKDILSLCIQHEIDHLNGILITDYINNKLL